MFRLKLIWYALLVGSTFAGFPDIHSTTFEGVPDNWFDASPFEKIGSKYYLIEGKVWVSWYAAAHACRRHNAQLATIESDSQMKALQQYLNVKEYKSNNFFWLGANDLDKEGSFFWLGTGQPVGYMDWKEHQPDNDESNEHCVQLTKDTQSGEFLLNDAPCRNGGNYVCQANDPRTISFTVW